MSTHRKRPANEEADDDLRVERIAAQLEERYQEDIGMARAAEAAVYDPPVQIEPHKRPKSTDAAQAQGGSVMASKSAPPDPGIMPGGIRDRALQAVLAPGPQPEDKEKTRRSQEYWAKYRAERVKRTDTAGAGITTPPLQGRPIAGDVIAEAGLPPSPRRRNRRKLHDAHANDDRRWGTLSASSVPSRHRSVAYRPAQYQ